MLKARGGRAVKSMVSVLIVGSCRSHDWHGEMPFGPDSAPSRVVRCQDPANALERLVLDNPDLCLIGSNVLDTPSLCKVLLEAREAGIGIPIIPVLRADQARDKHLITASGAMTPILDDAALPSILPLLTQQAAQRAQQMAQHREEKEALIKQLLDMRDAQERINDQSEQLVMIAEELELSKMALERLNSEKNKLFSIVAHDLRSPFNAILGYTEMMVAMADSMDRDRLIDYAATTHEAAGNVFKLMETMLDWARLQMDRIDTVPKPTELKDLLDQTVLVYGKIATEKGIGLTAHLWPIQAHCDPGMIDTVVRNLVNNAVKFTPSGGTIEVGLRETDDANRIEVYVKDTGLGLSPERLQKLFVLSEDVRTPGTAGEAGTGLGLLLCKDLVEKNGGRLVVTSEEGVGTEFSFSLPRCFPEPVTEAA